MIFSKLLLRNYNILIVLILISQFSLAQKTQRIAYIDMEYILENVPEYKKAEQTLNNKVLKWRNELDGLSREIEKLKQDLTNEKEILTASIIANKEDEIALKQKFLRQKEEEYFGANGSMYLFRKRIIYPVQDIVYSSVESIAKRYKYDFVLDKSSDLIMLYSNKKYDISELVLKSITVGKKRRERTKGKDKINQDNIVLSDAQQKKQNARLAAEKKKNDARLAQKKKIEEARAKKKKAIEDKRALLRKKKEDARKKKEEEKKKEQNDN